MKGIWNFPLAPEQASSFAAQHDLLFYVITILTVFFTVLVGAVVIGFTIRYRRGTKVDRSNPVHENMPLELLWSGIPLVMALGIFFWSTKHYIDVRTPPKDSMDIFVMGKQWMWHIQHPNGVRENNTLHVPIDRDIRLTMISQDVIHAFFVPEFRTQFMVVPGRYTVQWFRAIKPGKYHIFCNMYCGTQHSEMVGTVYAMPPADYAKWLEEGGNDSAPLTAEQRGAKLYEKLACANCHSEKDTERAPTLYGIAGSQRTMADGKVVTADLNYIRESILRPWDRLTKGYSPTMPMYSADNLLSEEDTICLIAYLGTLGPKGPTTAKPLEGLPQMGTPQVSKGSPNKPTLAVGALKYQNQAGEPEVMGQAKPGNLAVGALGAQDGGN